MAYDPEARETSNSAMIIGIVALVLVVGAVLAYYATRGNDEVATGTSTTIVDNTPPATNTVVVNPPATTPNTVVVERPVAVPVPQTKTIVRDSRTETTRVVPQPRTGGASSAPAPAPNVNVTTRVEQPAATGGTAGGGTAGGTTGGATGGTGGTAGATDSAAPSGDAAGGGTGEPAAGSELPPPAQ